MGHVTSPRKEKPMRTRASTEAVGLGHAGLGSWVWVMSHGGGGRERSLASPATSEMAPHPPAAPEEDLA